MELKRALEAFGLGLESRPACLVSSDLNSEKVNAWRGVIINFLVLGDP